MVGDEAMHNTIHEKTRTLSHEVVGDGSSGRGPAMVTDDDGGSEHTPRCASSRRIQGK